MDALAAAARMSSHWGVPLADLVDRVAQGLDQLVEADERRATAVAGARLSGYLLAGLPAVGVALGAGMGANPLPLLSGGGSGSMLLLVGVLLTCLGLVWSAAIAG